MVYKPPPKRKAAYAITTTEITNDDGFIVEIRRYHRLSEKDIDEASFFTLRDIFRSLAGNQVFNYFFSPFSC